MPFFPQIHDELTIDGIVYRFAEHPFWAGHPYGQEGRAATVYKLWAPDHQTMALKVFKPRFRLPALVSLTERIATFSKLPGLQVCQRTVLTPQCHGALLRQHPDLIYAVLMPWIEGPTWMDVLGGRSPLTVQQSRTLANALVHTLVTMEQRDLAHCDLSGSNMLLPALEGEKGIALVDVEGMYAPTLDSLRDILSATPGYGHQGAASAVWSTEADRFAGAVLLAEILGWCDPRAREAAAGDPAYFVTEELQQSSERYRVLTEVLQERWGDEIVRLFARAWRSETLPDCPTFGEWLLALSTPELRNDEHSYVGDSHRQVKVLLQQAQSLEQEGKLKEALEAYEQIMNLLSPGDPLITELEWTIADLGSQIRSKADSASAAHRALEQLADEGIVACDQGDWAKAVDLLEEVVRQSPGLVRRDREVAILLATAKKRLAAQQRRLPQSVLFGGPAAVVLVVILVMLLWNREGGRENGGTSVAPSPTPSLSATVEAPVVDETAEVTLTVTLTSTPSPTCTPSATPTPSATATDTPTPTVTATSTPTHTPTPTQTLTPTPTLIPTGPALGDGWVRPLDNAEMVFVPAGSFNMGSGEDQINYTMQLCRDYGRTCERVTFTDEEPVHTVKLDNFWLDRTEVTNQQYSLCVAAGRCTPPAQTSLLDYGAYYGNSSYANYPVVWVSWRQASAYCAWVGARLPWEAEWEYAARGPRATFFPWGDQFDSSRLNYCDARCGVELRDVSTSDGYRYTAPVASYSDASWCGARDLAGNVWEWVEDWYLYYETGKAVSPGSRVLRGGTWHLGPDSARGANRDHHPPETTHVSIGFRCAKDQ